MVHYWYYDLPLIGRCGIAENGQGISRVFLPSHSAPPAGEESETPLLAQAAAQLAEYGAGQRRTFALPLAPGGTPFQKRVWALLMDIPYGSTTTYGALAIQLGKPGGAQAVGQAVGANPLPFLIPCHRVVGRGGAITGYALGVELKQELLSLEQR